MTTISRTLENRPVTRTTTTTPASVQHPPKPQAASDRYQPPRSAPVELDGTRASGTKDAAIARARELIETGRVPGATTVENGIITNDAPNVNDTRDLTGQRAVEAKKQLLDNAQLEGDALLTLSPTDRARYQTVKDSLLTPSPGKPNGDPVAALSLQTMLLEGKLPGDRAIGSRDTVLSGFEKLATQEVGPGVDRQQLLADVVQEVATPASVSQSTKGTCMATSIEIQLLQNNPAEYVRLVSGLASPAAEVRTAGGDTLKVEPDALTDATGRSVSQRLLAPALMELGNGVSDYSNTLDQHLGPERNGENGLTAAQGDRILGSLYGRDFTYLGTGNATEKARGTEFVVDRVNGGSSTVVGLQWTESGHGVLVTGTEQRDGQEYVKIINPWGREESILRSEFEERLLFVSYDPNA